MAKRTLGNQGSAPEKKTRRSTPAVDDNDGEDIGGGQSAANLFDDAKPEEGFGIPQGSYEAIIVGAELKKAEDLKKESIEMTFEVQNHRDDEMNGKTVKTWYNLIDKDGKAAKGMGFWKRDAEVLGYPCKYAELEETLEQLVNDQVEVAITVKINGQFTNVYINGLLNG